MALKTTIYSDLEKIVGSDYISDALHVHWTYSRDFGISPGHLPDVVIKPQFTNEVQDILRIANTQKIPVYVRGAGVSYAGGVIPEAGGILLDLTRMNRLLHMDTNSDSCLVECCITCGTLMRELEKQGYKLPVFPDSALVATVGGFLATSGVGSWGSALYGSIADVVLGLKVVLPNGKRVVTGSGTSPYAKGHFNRYVGMPDFTGLFIGSEGTLGVMTEIALRVVPLPEETIYFAYKFKNHQAAERTAIRAKRKGLHLVSIDIITSLQEPPRLDAIIESNEKTARIEEKIFEEIAQEEGGEDLGHDIAQRGYEGIFNPGEQFLQGSRVIIGVIVPLIGIGDYLDMIKQECLRMSKKYEFPYRFGAFNVLNSWDVYTMFYYNERDPIEVQKGRKANEELQNLFIETGGIPTKRGRIWNKFATQSQAFGLFQTIKSCLDPNNIMSPGVHGLGL
ncbi:MAG: FAD-binding oxidoreductase [Candidatus Heimdallarchaeota archaeon]